MVSDHSREAYVLRSWSGQCRRVSAKDARFYTELTDPSSPRAPLRCHWISLNLPCLLSLGRRRIPERSATDVPCRVAEPSWPRDSLPIAQLYHSTIRSSNRDTERVFATRRVRARVYLLSARALCSLARRVFPELLESKNATKSAATIAIAFGFNFLPEASPGQGVVSTFGVTSQSDGRSGKTAESRIVRTRDREHTSRFEVTPKVDTTP